MEKYNLIKPDSKKSRKRVGRGPGSGMGKTCTRGQNGQLSRSGSGHPAGFEGGQMPIQRRIPKRGFTNHKFKTVYQIVNLEQLEKISGETEITSEVLKKKGLIATLSEPVKVLSEGVLSKKISIVADAFSKSAIAKIEKAGGKVVIRK